MPGDRAIDATAGNGHDTLFLANTVGTTGKVIAFDIQDTAIDATAARTSEHPQVELYCLGHEEMGRIVTRSVHAVMFNLGYLPSGDKSLITRKETTLQALQAALDLLDSGGLITVALYRGHEGGMEESDAVEAWASRLDQNDFYAASYQFLNLRNSPPSLLTIERRNHPS